MQYSHLRELVQDPNSPFKMLGDLGDLFVYTNGSGEVFVARNLGDDAQAPTIRVGVGGSLGITVTAMGFIMQPSAVNGLPAFVVSER